MDKLSLIKKICSTSIIGFDNGGAARTKSPELTLSEVNSDLIDLNKHISDQRNFERTVCQHILCGDTRDSCVMISILLRLFKPKVVYEIGRYRGWSTTQMAYALKKNFDETGEKAKFISIDPHIGAPGAEGWSAGLSPEGTQCGGIEEWNYSRDNIKRAGMWDFVTPVKAFSAEYVKEVTDEIDFIFVDGDHSYKAAKEDVEEYGKKLVSGGICVLHDVWGENFTGNANWGPSKVYASADEDVWEKIGFTWNVGILLKK